MPKHVPTVLAEASLSLHRTHAGQRDHTARMEAAEPIARAELIAEGKPLTVRNVIERQFEIVARA